MAGHMSDDFHPASQNSLHPYDATLSLGESSDESGPTSDDTETSSRRLRENPSTRKLSQGMIRFLGSPEAAALAERPSMHGTLFATPPAVFDSILEMWSSLPTSVAGSSRVQAPPLASSPSTDSESTTTPSVFSKGDSSTTTGTSAEQSINLSGGIPSHTQPFMGEFGLASQQVRDIIQVFCIFKRILQSPCDEHHIDDGFEPWYRHVMGHFDGIGPPPSALCAFCNAHFRDERYPRACWKKYLEHLYVSHLRNDRDIADMRPDFVTLRYFLDKGMISQARYSQICERDTERPQYNFPWQRPNTWEPEEQEAKEYRDSKRDATVMVESPVRRRPRAGDVPRWHPVTVTRGHTS